MSSVTNVEKSKTPKWEKWLPSLSSMLITVVVLLLMFSLLMVASASIPFTQAKDLNEFYFFYRQLIYILGGGVLAFVVYCIPLRWIFRLENIWLALAICAGMISFTLLQDEINGSRRWVELGILSVQPAEFTKLVMVILTADFVVRRSGELREDWIGLIRIGIIVFFLIILIAFQKDFGSMVMIGCTVASMIFVAGLRVQQVVALCGIIVTASIVGVITERYRMKRVLSFIDPFQTMQGDGYQLASSIIAYARGELTGTGYGGSLQKLAGLPEAHTDFLLAITGEELGFVGVSALLILQISLIVIIMRISYLMLQRHQFRLGYFAFGIATLLFGQVFINAGMTMGLLPTKGLTMPFFSYGGSSMIVGLLSVGILLRILKESPTIEPINCRYY